jgi:hypothetical protein
VISPHLKHELALPTVEEECEQFAAAVEEVLTARAALILESAA